MFVFISFNFNANAQTYIYKLSENFNGNVPEAPPLVQIPNKAGLNGDFVSRTVPSTTCEQGGTAGGIRNPMGGSGRDPLARLIQRLLGVLGSFGRRHSHGAGRVHPPPRPP